MANLPDTPNVDVPGPGCPPELLQPVFTAGAKISAVAVAIALGPALFGIDVSWLCAMLALLVYSLAGPLLAYRCRSFWLGALVAFATWLGMFALLSDVANAIGRHHSGEGAMVLLLPMMLFPCVLGLVGLLRFGQWVGRSAGPAPAERASPPHSET